MEPGRASVTDAQVDAVLAASRAFVGIAARSLALTEQLVSLPQWRVLVVVSRDSGVTLGELAATLGVHPSSATRACDRLVAAGLLSRDEAPGDRRALSLSLTAAGRQLVRSVARRRRAALVEVLDRVPARRRAHLVEAMAALAEAAGEQLGDPLWDATG